MNIGDIALKMTELSRSDLHDINHFMKVWAFARAIGELELENERDRESLEIAAIVHDIACPLCREKYGSARGDMQELEGMPLADAFLEPFGLERAIVERVVWLVGHHHSVDTVESVDHRILLEADLLVNANEGGYSEERLESEAKKVFRTETGIAFLRMLYPNVNI